MAADPGHPDIVERHVYLDADLSRPECIDTGRFRVGIHSARRPGKSGPNEDGALCLGLSDGSLVIAVADGMGGHAAGEQAAATALHAIEAAVRDALAQGRGLRAGVVDGIDAAHAAVQALQGDGGTTLVAATIEGQEVRTIHVGDAAAVLMTGQGRPVHTTASHSPVGYALEAGLLDEDEAIVHVDRHLVSNAVGLGPMKIELGPVLDWRPRHTLVLGSDGLFDNLRLDEITTLARKGPVRDVTGRLADLARVRMGSSTAGLPSKPDDLTFLVIRNDGRRARRS